MLTRDLEQALHEFAIDTPPAPRTVLLVDDERENLEVLGALLEDEHDILTAADGAAALRLLAAGSGVDLVIADQRMPGMTGVELLTRIAAEHPDTVRMVLTAYDDVGPMMEAINRGSVFRFLLKPCAPTELRLAVREGLEAKASAALLRHLIGALGARQDELARVVRHLRRTQDQLIATERLTTMGRAASGVVHNVRNLGMIVSCLVTEIQASTPGAGVVAAGRSALEGLDSLVALLESVREFARSNEAELELARTELEPFLQQTVGVALLEHGGRSCSVEVEVSPDVASVSIDRARVRHAVAAVLSNALYASPQGGVITIRASAHRPEPVEPGARQRWFRVDVEDHGCGMDALTLAKAGEPLYSGFDPPRLGLGLTVARLTAAIHGGELVLESAPGEGTRARLIFPDGPGTSLPPRSRASVPVAAKPEDGAPILGFVASQRAPLRVQIAAHAAAELEPALAVDAELAATLHRLDPATPPAPGPAVLVLSAQDLRGPQAEALREVARGAAPGRPIIVGGADDRRVLLEAINEWRAHSLVPRGAPRAAITEAIRRAHEQLKVDIAVELCARQVLDECRRLATTIAELEATQERLLHAERLATVGRVVGALIARMGAQSRQLEGFREALRSEPPGGTPSRVRRRADLGAYLGEVHEGFNSLLADMLALAEDRPPSPRLASEDLDVLVSRTVRVFQYDPLGRERNVRVSPASGAQVRVDGSRVRHALLNLLRNAAQATQQHGSIQVRTWRDGDTAVVEVVDDGEGMSDKTLSQLFTPFFTTKGTAGMGLGLRLARAAVEGHGGSLECTSVVGRGTTFRIRLPVVD